MTLKASSEAIESNEAYLPYSFRAYTPQSISEAESPQWQ